MDFYEICRNQLLEDSFTEKIELEYAGNACHFWFKKNAFLAEEINVSINKYKRPKIMYIPSERNVPHATLYKLATGNMVPSFIVMSSLVPYFAPAEWVYFTDEEIPYEVKTLETWNP